MDLTQTLSLKASNPYSRANLLEIEPNDIRLERRPLVYKPSPKDRYYTFSDGEDVFSVAGEAYPDAQYYWVILEVNNVSFPYDIETGDTLVIPDLDDLFNNPANA
jgi:hypothetical protein